MTDGAPRPVRPLVAAVLLTAFFGIVELPFAAFMADDLIQLAAQASRGDLIGLLALHARRRRTRARPHHDGCRRVPVVLRPDVQDGVPPAAELRPAGARSRGVGTPADRLLRARPPLAPGARRRLRSRAASRAARADRRARARRLRRRRRARNALLDGDAARRRGGRARDVGDRGARRLARGRMAPRPRALHRRIRARARRERGRDRDDHVSRRVRGLRGVGRAEDPSARRRPDGGARAPVPPPVRDRWIRRQRRRVSRSAAGADRIRRRAAAAVALPRGRARRRRHCRHLGPAARSALAAHAARRGDRARLRHPAPHGVGRRVARGAPRRRLARRGRRRGDDPVAGSPIGSRRPSRR